MHTVVGLQNCTRGLWRTRNGLYWIESNGSIQDYGTGIWYGVLFFHKHRKVCPINPFGNEYRDVIFEFVSNDFCWNFVTQQIQ